MDHPIEGVAERVQDARPSVSATAGSAADTPGAARAGLQRAADWQARLADGEVANRARALVHMQPITAVLGAGVIGLAVGWLIGRRR